MNWPRIAEKLARAVPLERWHPAVRAELARVANQPRRWAVALSGGADSVAVLLLVWTHFPAQRKGLLALHFDHRQRGRASTGDRRFCAALCRGLGVRLVTAQWENAPQSASEAAARAERIRFFNTQLREKRIGKPALLFTGHHRDDVAETFLMRLARGAGAAGLSAPRPVQEHGELGRVHLRPLLGLDKAEVVAALRGAGGRWREDETNGTTAYLRNRVRAEVIPVWRKATAEGGREALGGLALSRELLAEDDEALEIWAERAGRVDVRGRLRLVALRGLPRAVLRRVLRRWLAASPACTDLNRAGFEGLMRFVQTGRTGARHSLGAGHFALLSRALLACVTNVPKRE